MKKAVLVLIWAACVVIAALLVFVYSTADRHYSGKSISFTTSDDYTIVIDSDAESVVTFEAASDSFFVLRNPNGGVISGTPTQKPLGWQGNSYFLAEPMEVRGGLWVVEKGSNITVRLSGSNSSNLTVLKSMSVAAKSDIFFSILLTALAIWVLGLIIGAAF